MYVHLSSSDWNSGGIFALPRAPRGGAMVLRDMQLDLVAVVRPRFATSKTRGCYLGAPRQGSAQSPFGFGFGFGVHWTPESKANRTPPLDSDSWVQMQSDSSLDSDSWVQIQPGSSLDSGSWVQIKSGSSLDSDSWVQSKSDSSLDSGSWLARAVGLAGGPRSPPPLSRLRLGKEQPPPQGGGRWS
jgi:hypothetical protein